MSGLAAYAELSRSIEFELEVMGTRLRKLIAASQLVGAVLVVLSLCYELAQRLHQRAFPDKWGYLIAAYLFAACVLGIWAGQLLWRNRPLGHKLSIATQALQVPLVLSSPVSYTLMFGVGVWVYVTQSGSSWGVETKFRFGERYQFSVAGAEVPVEIGLNLLACYFIYRLWRTVREATGPSMTPNMPLRPDAGETPASSEPPGPPAAQVSVNPRFDG